MERPDTLIDFWLNEVGPKGWYMPGDGLDQTILDRYQNLWAEAADGGLAAWQINPRSMLAYLILTDQFPRNMFRDTGKAFSTDRLARAAAKHALDAGFDLRIAEPERQFFYLPLMHSECITDQDRCVRLMLERMPETGAENLRHAKAHREVIRRYGRFPTRNAALERSSSQSEQIYLSSNGYGEILETLKAA